MENNMRRGICPKCHSGEIVPNAEAVDHNALSIRVYEKAGVMLRGMRSFPVRAWVCTNCGYTEFYVDNPSGLAQSYRRSMASLGAG
jgi:predicted nucleic-acid-binding Zn-ribbon protein